MRAIGRARIGWLREPLLSYRLHAANTIREPDQWRHIAERGLVYAAFLGQHIGRRDIRGDKFAISCWNLANSRPVVVSWLLSECRRLGLAPILRELESRPVA